MLVASVAGCKKTGDVKLPEIEIPVPTFTALSPSSAKVGEVLTISGTNFSTITTENEVRFTASSNGTVTATVKTASKTALIVEIPATAISGSITIKVKGLPAVLPNGFNASFTLNSTPPVSPPSSTTAMLSTYNTEYYLPDHIATDAQGNVYTTGLVAGKQLIRINPKGERTKVYGPTDFGLPATEQPYIVGVCNDSKGAVWVLMVIANKPCRLYKILAGEEPILDRSIDNTESLLKTISVPDMAMASNGELFYVVEHQNYRVRKIDKTGKESYFITAVNGTNPFGASTNSVAVSDLSFDSNDVMYLSVNNAQTFGFFGIFSYTLAGVQTKIYSSTTRGDETPVEGQLSTINFRNLISLEVSGDGKSLYAGDGNYLRKISLTDNKVTTVAGTGKQSTITYTYNGDALKGNTLPAKLTFSADQKNIIINSYGVLEKFSF